MLVNKTGCSDQTPIAYGNVTVTPLNQHFPFLSLAIRLLVIYTSNSDLGSRCLRQRNS